MVVAIVLIAGFFVLLAGGTALIGRQDGPGPGESDEKWMSRGQPEDHP